MQNAQRLLKPWKIANPYAKHLTFTSGRTRTRRDHEKYLTLIDSIKMGEGQMDQRSALFSRKELREQTGWSETQTRLHLERLEQMEYVHRRSGKQGSLCRYELLTDANEPKGSWHVGLIDVAKLKKKKSA